MTSDVLAATPDGAKSRAEPGGVLERHAIPWLVVLCVPLFFVALASYDLDSKGEPREGLTAWATIHQDFLLPVLNGERLPEKPLLFPWIVSLSMRVFGETSEWALRLPSALMATGLVLVVHALGRRLVSRRAGLLAATAFASTFLVVSLARRARVDMTLSFFVCTALLLFLAEFEAHAADPSSRRSAWRVAGFWTALALATLTKGPLGAILPWLVIGPYLLLRRRLSFLRTLCPLWGIAILVVGAGSWYAYGLATRGGEFGFRTFLMENILMFMGSEGGGGHQHGFFYFVPNYALFGMPWSLFLPAAAFAALRRARRGGAAEPLVLPLVWFAAMFLFFSVASGKRSDYLLPLMPAAALLVGALVADPGEDRVIRRLWTGTAAVVAVVGLVVVALVATAVSPSSAAWLPASAREYLKREGAAATTSALRSSPVALVTVLACAVLASSAPFLWRRRVHGGIPAAAGSLAVAAAIAVPAFLPALSDAQSSRPFAEEVRGIVPPGTDLRRYGTYDSQLLFYLHETVPPIGTRSEMRAFLDAPGEAYVVADAESIAALPPEDRDRLERVVASAHDSGDETVFLLLRRRGAEPPTSPR
jgi:4-amino-4-deoxy-L-arabinose transferase-like glycosyltransferase